MLTPLDRMGVSMIIYQDITEVAVPWLGWLDSLISGFYDDQLALMLYNDDLDNEMIWQRFMKDPPKGIVNGFTIEELLDDESIDLLVNSIQTKLIDPLDHYMSMRGYLVVQLINVQVFTLKHNNTMYVTALMEVKELE